MLRVVSTSVCRSPAPGAFWVALALGTVCLSVYDTAHAGSIEYAGRGPRALGRGGAFAARADDPMAMLYNPAALSDLTGSQVMLNLQNAFLDACVTREGTYGDAMPPNGTTDRYGDFADYRDFYFPRVCQNNRINPGLWVAYTTKLTDAIGIGFGVMTPAAAGHLIWGDGKGSTKDGSLPSPVRYQLIEQDGKVLDPTFSVSAKAGPRFSLGVSLQWGMAFIRNVNHTLLNGGENPSEDVFSELLVSDLFIPAMIASAQIVPHDNFDLAIYGRVSDDVRAEGKAKVRTPAYSESLTRDSNDDVTARIPVPGYAGLALRYADRFQPRVDGKRGDPMVAEKWDLELDLTYHMTSRFDTIAVNIPALPRAGLPNGIKFELEHYWKDQISIQLGGDYNVLPGVLALRAGAHYESSAIAGSYMGIDFQPAQRLGLHAGATYRVGKFDLSFSYAHIFQETITIPKSDAAYRQIADANPVVVNAGKYESRYDVVSFGATYRFGMN